MPAAAQKRRPAVSMPPGVSRGVAAASCDSTDARLYSTFACSNGQHACPNCLRARSESVHVKTTRAPAPPASLTGSLPATSVVCA